MARLFPMTLVASLAVLMSCQPVTTLAPGTATASPSLGPTPSSPGAVSPTRSAGPAVTLSAAPTATASSLQSPAGSPLDLSRRELVLGSLFDDQGAQLDRAQVDVVCPADPSVNQTIQAPGSFAFRAPVGSLVTVSVSRANFTPRTRTLKVEAVAGNQNTDANRLDFGGNGPDAFFALSEYPEISTVSPANQQTGVASSPLVVQMTFSHSLSAKTRDRFGTLLQLRFQSPTGVQIVRSGTTYNDQPTTLVWDSSYKLATLTFPAPVVASRGAAAAVTLGFDTSAQLSDWPQGDNGRYLGRDFVFGAQSGTGAASGAAQVAPILRDHFTGPAPVVRPSPLTLWGLTHWTDVTFTLSQDLTPLGVTSIGAIPGDVGQDDFIKIVFAKPVRGFPESALDGSVLRSDYYHFAFGASDTKDAIDAYNAADPSQGGGGAIGVTYNTSDPKVVFLHLGHGTVSRYNRFKLYLDPRIKDINGAALAPIPANPAANLSANVLEGRVQ
jgi:hypothetical protein